jgi:NTP pyrophosphatase (non-canonical NTP hydrolase)
VDAPGVEISEQRLAEQLAGLWDARPGRERAEVVLGDLLLSLAAFARLRQLDAETALRDAVTRLEARLRRRERERGSGS